MNLIKASWAWLNTLYKSIVSKLWKYYQKLVSLIKSAEAARILFWLAIATAATFVLILATSFLESENRQTFYGWLQLATGSSWPPWKIMADNHRILFSLVSTLHVMLNVAPLLGVVWIGLKLLHYLQRRETVEFAEALKLRDMSIKARVENKMLHHLPGVRYDEFSSKIDEIFTQATEDWQPDLEEIIGPERALEAVEILKRQI